MAANVPSTAAYSVLRDRQLMCRIASFQRGLPRDIVEFARDATNNPHRLRLPHLAVRCDDVAMLDRVYRLYCEQRSTYDRKKDREMSFVNVWFDALREGKLKCLAWINAHAELRPNELSSFSLSPALGTGSIDVVQWLFDKHPACKPQLTSDIIEVSVGEKGHLELFKWLEANVESLPCSPYLMDIVAVNGHLDFVEYLHLHRTEGCTTEAMDGAMRQGHGHIVRFLHEHRTEGATRDAMRYAARNGDIEMVRFLHEHRTEGCDELALEKAAKRGHLEIVQFLHEHYHSECTGEAMFEAAKKGRFDVIQYLNSHCEKQDAGNSVVVAAEHGHLEIVRHLVETRTDGCVFSALEAAKCEGHTAVAQYLEGVVDPRITACCMYTDHAIGERRRKCQRRR